MTPTTKRPILLVLRGLPGCGKTTEAMTWVREDPAHRARSSRDALRVETFAATTGRLSYDDEKLISRLQEAMVSTLLRVGRSVVVDDTNLDDLLVHYWRAVATAAGAECVVRDLRDVPVATCIERDAARGAAGGRLVGAEVIQRLADGTLSTTWGRGRPG